MTIPLASPHAGATGSADGQRHLAPVTAGQTGPSFTLIWL